MPGTLPPQSRKNRKKLMVAGEVQNSFVFPLFLFPRLLRGSRAANSNFTGPGSLSGYYRGPGLLRCVFSHTGQGSGSA